MLLLENNEYDILLNTHSDMMKKYNDFVNAVQSFKYAVNNAYQNNKNPNHEEILNHLNQRVKGNTVFLANKVFQNGDHRNELIKLGLKPKS